MSAVRSRARRSWLLLHRWLGLVLGLWFLLLGLTGSMLVYYRGIDEQIDARLAHRPQARALPTLESVYQSLRRAHPQREAGWRLEVPQRVGEPVTARFLKPVETQGRGFAPLLATVDPVSLEVVANRFWGEHATTWIYDLHYTLLLGEPGHQIVGWGGLVLLVSVVSGAVLWWPARGQWSRALHFKRHASGVRRVYDLHKLAGVYGGLVLLILGFTGAVLALPDVVRPWVAQVSPLTPMPKPVPSGASGPRWSVDAAVARAVAVFPGSEPRWVDVPAAPGGLYRVRLRQPGEPGDRFPDSLVWVDSVTGQVVAQRDPKAYTGGDVFLQWMHPLHSGEGFGAIGRLIVCVSGLVPVLLAVTGWLRWRDKRRARRPR